MVAQKKPSDLARDKINRRTRKTLILAGKKMGRLTDADKKTPSQKHSEAGKKREIRRAGTHGVWGVEDVPEDCNGCPQKKGCGKLLEMCGEKYAIHKCLKCGVRVRYRVNPDKVWEHCPVCRGI